MDGGLAALAKDMRAAGLLRLELELPSGEKLRLRRRKTDVSVAIDLSEPAAAEDLIVTSKAVGRLLLEDPSSGLPLVRVNERIPAGAILGFVQIDLLLRPIAAPAAGLVDAILSTSGCQVEYGTSIFSLKPNR